MTEAEPTVHLDDVWIAGDGADAAAVLAAVERAIHASVGAGHPQRARRAVADEVGSAVPPGGVR
jgi:hypothetical protein